MFSHVAFAILLVVAPIASALAEDKTTTYHNPVDKKDYTAKWHTYSAEPTGLVSPPEKVSMETMRLLADQDLFDRNISLEKLAAFVKGVQDRVTTAVPKAAPGFEFLVQVTLSREHRPKFEISAKDEHAPQKLLKAIDASLRKAPDIRSKTDVLPLQLSFVVHAHEKVVVKSTIVIAPDQAPAESPKSEFVTQILEPTGGKIPRPKDWFYVEKHHGPVYDWIISREDTQGGKGPYTTGVRIQMFYGVKEGTGKSPRQFILDLVETKRAEATKVLKNCDETDQGLFTRVCLETEEGPYHILYSLFWGSTGMDIAVVDIAGTNKELWETYAPVFNHMSFELIDMKRFEK